MADAPAVSETAPADPQVCADPQFRADVLAGLALPQPAIPARWFYDHQGSALFSRITALPEYYPTRTEIALLEHGATQLAEWLPQGAALVEFGAGSQAKTPLLLRAIRPARYVPIDISGRYLREAAAVLASDFPGLDVTPVEADFTQPLSLPDLGAAPRVGFFPGSTIGNFTPDRAIDLLRGWHQLLGDGALLLIGVDRIKDPAQLIAAYDDAQGVTAAFNRNLLARINRELGGTIPLAAFAHEARWNKRRARIEMHLVARRDVAFTVAGQEFDLAAGQTIHTENSHKYGLDSARLLLAAAGWTPLHDLSDEARDFTLFVARADPPQPAP